ncbi:hypothetical protein Afil01_51860 [Actinorhabdospora filicis]|uniref:Uncharacterized protein n=1 Tax=Actinorhabdospora filicis TaxID=1785913 RepID=A0A9W6SQY6_9ACTN|nr:hypothetical protein [Actinorhabdospora filicis]GLZ80379.1 hypothetical protein Afil01_51860 [Actinorhabdospora filicis]
MKPGTKPKGGVYAILAALLAFCALAAVGGYLLIDNLADRGPASPKDAVDGFLTALLADRDPQAARRYVCPDIRDSDFTANLEAITAEEQKTGEKIAITWDKVLTTGERGGNATVTADVSSATSAGTEASTWTFTVIKAPRWYVCGFATPG